MRIAIVGPTHPYKGGIAQHTTQLAHHLVAAGHTVEIISWRAQYPFFYPGQQFVPENQPELPIFPHVHRVLSWKRPDSWLRWGRKLRQYDEVIFVWWVPTIQGPIYSTMLRAMGRRRPGIAIVCHNALPHEPRAGDKLLARRVLGAADIVITHTHAQAEVAAALTPAPITTVKLPLSFPISKLPQVKKTVTHELLFWGFVRPYKGVDVLLEALAAVPDVKLTVAGEFWGGTEQFEQQIAKLGLENRVQLQDGYLPAESLAKLIQSADAVILPYKEGTASWNITLTFMLGTPVIATKAGSLGTQVRDGIDGLLCQPNDPDSLSRAIKQFYTGNTAQKLRAGIPPDTTETDWRKYVAAITSSTE